MYPYALTHGRKTRIDRNDKFNRKFIRCMFGRRGEKDRAARIAKIIHISRLNLGVKYILLRLICAETIFW